VDFFFDIFKCFFSGRSISTYAPKIKVNIRMRNHAKTFSNCFGAARFSFNGSDEDLPISVGDGYCSSAAMPDRWGRQWRVDVVLSGEVYVAASASSSGMGLGGPMEQQ
jgi:hypothetical protein